MEISHAVAILRDLADGVNPNTGELLPPDDSCNQADVVRALHTILANFPKITKKDQPQTENAGKPWTKEDENLLCEMFDNGKSKSEICACLGRTSGAIAARLVKLGKIDDRDSFRRMR